MSHGTTVGIAKYSRTLPERENVFVYPLFKTKQKSN